MSKRTDPELFRIAKAVADRTTVAWDRLGTVDGESARKIRHLKLVDEISAAYGNPPATAGSSALDRRPAPPEIPERWGKLELREQIGAGGFATVYRAYDPDLDQDVALKLLNPEIYEGNDDARAVFLSEARRLARVRHANVITVHGVEEHDGRIGLWMDLLEGMTLEEWLDLQGPLSAEQAALVGIDLCRALAAVHAEGLVHRDVKTSNVFRETGGRIVLMDFGSSAERKPETSRLDLRRLSGTPAYMAPELFRGTDSGRRVDVYAMGVLLYRLVTGLYPAPPDLPYDRRGEHVPLRDRRADVPLAFVRVIERALSVDFEARYRGAGEMERALAECIGGLRGGDSPAAGPVWWTRPRVLVPAFTALVAAVALVVGLWPARFRVEAELFRSSDGFEQRLRDSARIVPGDKLFLEVEGTRPLHVYVLNRDALGETYVLFPLPDLERQNPLPAGRRLRLPGTLGGEPFTWQVTSAGGEEFLLVAASRQPLAELECALADVPRSAPGVPVRLDAPGLIGTLRGIGGLAPDPSPGLGSGSPLGEALDEVSIRAGMSRDVWMWEIRLSNP